MNKEALNQVVNGLINFVKDAKAFASAQIPDVIKQLITYTIVVDSIAVIFALSLLWPAWMVHKWIWAEKARYKYADTEFAYFIVVPMVVLSIGVCSNSGSELLQALVAPKLFLLNYLRGIK